MPFRADYQRDLSVSYQRVGDLYRAVGKGEEARQAFVKSLEIAERLAAAEPDRADYQRDLSVSYNRLGDLYRALGKGEEARQYFLKDLEIAERLAAAEPDRADYQEDLAVSLRNVGSRERALSILIELRAQERLSVEREPMIAELERALDQSE